MKVIIFMVYLILWTVGEIGTVISLLSWPFVGVYGGLAVVGFGIIWGLAFWLCEWAVKNNMAF